MGASHVRGFVAEGANVVVADVLEQEGWTLASELGDHPNFYRLDVTSERGWAATLAAAEDIFGPVSVLVNSAGIVRFGSIAETEPAAWRQVIDINLTGMYLGIRAVLPSMRKAGGGAIVNISSKIRTRTPAFKKPKTGAPAKPNFKGWATRHPNLKITRGLAFAHAKNLLALRSVAHPATARPTPKAGPALRAS